MRTLTPRRPPQPFTPAATAADPQAGWRLALIALSACLAFAGCGSDEAATGSAGGYGEWDAVTSDSGGVAGDTGSHAAAGDAGASDTASGWGSADTGASGWSDAGGSNGAAADASTSDTAASDAGDDDDAGGQSWQLTGDAPPLAQVSLGGGNTLELQELRVAVRMEGLRARVVVDHIFYNPFNKDIEGTFRYTLPPESSVSYYAMLPAQTGATPAFFGSGDGLAKADATTIAGTAPSKVVSGADKSVWGPAKEARVHRTVAATQVYEKETEKQIDPALVEQVAPNTFQAKVFPILAKGHNRVVLAWEQTLPSLPGQPVPGATGEAKTGRVYEYVFPVPMGQVDSFDFTLLAKKAQVAAAHALSGQPGLVKPDLEKSTGAGYIARYSTSGAVSGGKLVFHLAPAKGSPEADVLVGTDPVLQKDYAYLRLRPEIPGLAKGATATSAHAVFLLDTSRSSDPTRFGVALQLMQGVLASTPGIESFNVIPFDSGASWLHQGWLTNDQAGRAKAAATFDNLLLEGATDVSAALRTLANPTWTVPKGTPVDIFLLTDGALNWGERSMDAVLQRYLASAPWTARFFAYRLGIGAENLELFGKLTAQGGAVFDCLSPSALAGCAKAHTSSGLKLSAVTVVPAGEGGTGGKIDDVLVGGRLSTLFPGASVLVTGPLAATGAAKVVIQGTLADGTTVSHAIPVDLTPTGQLAPRAWAQVAISQLLGSTDPKFEGLAMALSQHYRVANRLASFLVLEDEKTWTQYDLKDESALFKGQPLAKVIAAAAVLGEAAWSTWTRLTSALKAAPGAPSNPQQGQGSLVDAALLAQVSKAVGAAELELLPPALPWAGVTFASTPAPYLQALKSAGLDLIEPFTVEGERRRTTLNDLPAAVRALSTAVERDPGNDEVLRLVAYRLAAWGQTASAAELLLGVLLRRPHEPQSWRDLANVVADERPGLALVLFEAALQGDWPAKFKTLKVVVREEYALFATSLLASSPKHPLAATVQARMLAHGLILKPADLRVTVTWNTAATDIDLWVISPTGEKCYYQHKNLSTGGGLLSDLTDGYGPERFQVTKAMPGTWTVKVHYYGNNGNKLAAETWVDVAVTTDIGSPDAQVTHYTTMLKKKGDKQTMATVTFK